MITINSIEDLPKRIPIFPLTGAVLFPGTQLPLNIFESRYINMIDDALASTDRLIAMIQPAGSKDSDSKILKNVGDSVSEGEGIIVVEAMKMESELKTSIAGNITVINIKEGDTVELGSHLVTVESDDKEE